MYKAYAILSISLPLSMLERMLIDKVWLQGAYMKTQQRETKSIDYL